MSDDIARRLAEIKERWPVTDSDEREAAQDIRYLLAEIERLQARLEIDHHFVYANGETKRVEGPVTGLHTETWDGIACRDATIDLQNDEITRLTAELSDVRKNQPAVSVYQGYCDTTLTERFSIDTCKCDTYAENLGPCKTWLDNGNGRCSYCDHGPICHIAVLQPADGVVVCPVCNGSVPHTTT